MLKKKAIALLEAAKNRYPAISKDDIRCEQVRDYAKSDCRLKGEKRSTCQTDG